MIVSLQGKLAKLLGTPGRLSAIAGYLALATTMAVGLFSVPLAFKFMSEEEFGIWNLLGSTLGLLLLIDFGVSAASSRILAEPLNSGDHEEIDSWWTVLIIILAVQGLAMLLLGLAFEPLIMEHFNVRPDLRHDASLLWRALILASALKNPFQALTGVLFCQNRLHHMHLANVLQGLTNFAVFYILLSMGWKIKAYVGAVAISMVVTVVYWYIAVRLSGARFHFRPRLFSTGKLKTLYSYSGSIFVLTMASQMATASQPMIIASVLGLGTVAAYRVSTISFAVLGQLLGRTIDAKAPRWLILHVEGRTGEVVSEWRRMMRWLVPIAFFCAAGLLVFNRSFVGRFVSPEMHVGRLFDLVLAVTLVVQQLAKPLIFVFMMARRTWVLSVVGVVDALIQIGLARFFVNFWGAPGILFGALLGTLLTSTPFIFAMAPGLMHHKRRQMYGGFLWDLVFGALAGAALWFALPRLQAGAGWFPQPTEWYAAVGASLLAVWGLQRLVSTGLIRFRTH